MSYLHYSRSRSRERSLFDDSDPFYSRPLVRRNTKRARVITLSDNEDNADGADDYPYSPTHQPSRLSRALTLRREPSTLEKYNVWSYDKPHHHHHHDEDTEHHHRRRYHYTTTTKHYDHPHHHHSDSDRDEHEFRLKLRATFSKPSSSSHSSSSSSYWPGTLFRRREKLTNVDWETHERSRSRSRSREPTYHHRRRDSLFDDDDDEDDVFKEKSVRYRKVKRTRTDEFKPLSGFRRY